MKVTPVPRPIFKDPPANAWAGALRAAKSAIYTHKDALSAEHFARVGHDAVAAPVPGCETGLLVIAGTSAAHR